MAWTDQCKIAFKVNTNARLMKTGGKGIVRMLRQISRESGIPYRTLKNWWYEENSQNRELQESEMIEKQSIRKLCRVCGIREEAIHSDTGKPYRKGIIRQLCSPCRKKISALANEAREAIDGIETACPDCGRHFYVKETNNE